MASEEVVAVATVEAVVVSEVAVEALAVVATVIPIFDYLNLGFE